MDKLNFTDLKTKPVEELTDIIETCIKCQSNIIDIYIRAAKHDERYKIYEENLNLVKLAMQHKIGF